MIETTIIYFVSVWVGYKCRQPIYLGQFDPLKLLSLQEGAWVATVTWYYLEGSISVDQVTMFVMSIVIWWLTWKILSEFGRQSYRNAMRIAWQRVSTLDKGKSQIIFSLYLTTLITFTLFSIMLDGGGDGRLEISKLLRPLEGFIALLGPLVLFKLLINRRLINIFYLLIMVVMIIVSGGKAAIVSLLLPITAAELVGVIKIDKKRSFLIITVMLGGIIASIAMNYSGADRSILSVLTERLMMEGDIYIHALVNGNLNSVTVTSLPAYIFGPIIKVLMLPIQVDQNIGSQIGSAIAGSYVPTGPNGHWPILLMTYGLYANYASAIISCLFFLLVISIKLFLINPKVATKIRIAFILPMITYALQYPQIAFADPSYQFIYLVHMFFVAGILVMLFAFYDFLKNVKVNNYNSIK